MLPQEEASDHVGKVKLLGELEDLVVVDAQAFGTGVNVREGERGAECVNAVASGQI